MSGALGEARAALRLAARTIAARPGLVLLFAGVQAASNLLRFWIGGIEARGHGDSIIAGVGGLFLLARIFATQWLHVAAARVTDDPAVRPRAAFAVTTAQAGWFHAMVAVSTATFALRLWLNRASGGFFAPDSLANARELVPLTIGLLVTYLAFLPLMPGYFAALLERGGVPTLRWSLVAARGGIARAATAAMLLAVPPALVRRWLLALLGKGGAAVIATALLDAALTALLMMLATAIYYRLYRRGVAEATAPARPAPA